MSSQTRDMKDAKAKAKNWLTRIPGVQAIGVGDGVLRVYVVDPEIGRQLPDDLDGIEVELIASDDIAALVSS